MSPDRTRTGDRKCDIRRNRCAAAVSAAGPERIEGGLVANAADPPLLSMARQRFEVPRDFVAQLSGLPAAAEQ